MADSDTEFSGIDYGVESLISHISNQVSKVKHSEAYSGQDALLLEKLNRISGNLKWMLVIESSASLHGCCFRGVS